MVIGGIDFSLNGSGITTCEGDFSFENCKSYYITKSKKYDIDIIEHNIYGTLAPDKFNHDFERWNYNADWAWEIVKECDFIVMEGYSYGSKSSMTLQIAENAALIKNKLYKSNIEYIIVPPSRIKKFATGKGNANKELMHEAFENEVNIKIKPMFKQTDNQWSPSGDIIDSFYMCKYASKYIKGEINDIV